MEMIMDFYEIRGDEDYLQLNCFDAEDTALLADVAREGASIDRTRPIRLVLGDFDKWGEFVETDFPGRPAYGVTMMSDRAVAALGDMLNASGYLLDTVGETITHYNIYICEQVIDAFDQERSDVELYPDGGVRRIFRYELKADLLQGRDIFRLKGVLSSVFVSGRFVDLVHQHDLTGLHMTKIWSTETGGLPYQRPKFASGKEEVEKRRLMRARIAARDAREALLSRRTNV
jgi:hypothetical protein